ncbi:MAG: glycosyltransferase family 4 protein [Candidatus Saccharibacteria bacterium]|nr:glycosyltransferase family 4 protein [Candidatus Saccharibacteria bacterium]
MTRQHSPLRIDMISESEFTVQGHGVHTAYVEITDALKRRSDTDVAINVARSGADIIHTQTIGLYSLRKLRQSRAKKVISGHIIPASLVGSVKGMGRLQWLVRRYMKWAYGKADLVLACSGMVRDEMVGPMGLKNRVEVLYNTVDMQKYAHTKQDTAKARQVLRIQEDAFVVLGNGQVQPRKRLDTFFAAARALPEVQFVWVGGIPFKRLGAEYGKMQDMIQSAPKNVTITGIVPYETVIQYLHAADVFFLPAEQENHPMCVLEAAGAGLPIILRDIAEYNDTFRPDAQFIATDDDAVAAITKLRDDTAFYAEQQQAATRIAERFDSKAGAERLMAFYRELLES